MVIKILFGTRGSDGDRCRETVILFYFLSKFVLNNLIKYVEIFKTAKFAS